MRGDLLSEVKEAIRVPIAGVVSDGQQSIRRAVEVALRARASRPLSFPLST